MIHQSLRFYSKTRQVYRGAVFVLPLASGLAVRFDRGVSERPAEALDVASEWYKHLKINVRLFAADVAFGKAVTHVVACNPEYRLNSVGVHFKVFADLPSQVLRQRRKGGLKLQNSLTDTLLFGGGKE